jgi:rod shape-determining protein MreC
VAATVIGAGAGSNSKTVFVDRGSLSGIERGMAVVTPDGIVGKVIAAYPTASEVLLITDPDFAAGVISQKTQVRGTLKGQGNPMCKVDYVPYEVKVQPGEWFYTSGDDRVFPRGFPVGVIKAVRKGQNYQDIVVEPSGLRRGIEDVLILVQSVHQAIPETPPSNQPVYIAPPLPDAGQPAQPAQNSGAAAGSEPAGAQQQGTTEADKLRTLYKNTVESQGYKLGDSGPRSRPADFTKLGQTPPPAPKPQGGAGPAAQPAAAGQPAATPAAPAANAPKPAAPQGAQSPATQRRSNPPSVAPAAPAGQTGEPQAR